MKHVFSRTCLLIAGIFSGVVQAVDTAADQLKYKLARLNSYQASFQQTVTDATQQQVQQGEGYLSLKQPSMFRFETISPSPNLLIGDGRTLWHYSKQKREPKKQPQTCENSNIGPK